MKRASGKRSGNLSKTLRRALGPALAMLVIAFFGAYAVFGPNGVFAYGDYQRQLVKREAEYAQLDHRRAVIRNRVALLDPDHATPDMVDEMARRDLDVVHPDEVVVPTR